MQIGVTVTESIREHYPNGFYQVPMKDDVVLFDEESTPQEQYCEAAFRSAVTLLEEVRANPAIYTSLRKSLIDTRLALGKALFAIDEIQPEYQLRTDENGIAQFSIWKD